MLVDAISDSAPARNSFVPTLVRAWLLTAITDAIFSSVLISVFYGSTVARLWQGVASVLLGPTALEGGMRTVLIGLLMHLGVALTWSTVFLILYSSWPALQRLIASPGGVIKVASIYGPCIWMVMSFVVVATLTHKPPAITYRWWIQFFGHIPFVAVPIGATIGRWRPA